MDARFGRLTFQSNDRADVFAVVDVYEVGKEPTDEAFLLLDDPDFESSSAWLTGRVPQFKPVDIEGDTSRIRVWYQGEKVVLAYIVRIYIEYEEVEEFVNISTERRSMDQGPEKEDCPSDVLP